MSKAYKIENFNGLVNEMSGALDDEHLAGMARLLGIEVPNIRIFWMEFVVSHLANSCNVNVMNLKSGDMVDAELYLDKFGDSLKELLGHYEFSTIVRMKMEKFGTHFVLPNLAGIISPEFKDWVASELMAGQRQVFEDINYG